jgi:predicted RecB family nuclease
MARQTPLPHLSKSRFMAGRQCHKRLWFELFQRELAAEVDAVTQARFDEGTLVGVIARGYMPGGTLVEESREELAEALRRTRALLADKAVPALYEATVSHGQVLIRADILRRNRGGSFDLLEVKSSTQAKPEHLWDVAIQAHVLRGAGLKLRRMGVLHLDNTYVYSGGEHDPQGLFALADLTAEVEAVLPDIPGLLASMRAALRSKAPPAIAPGDQCTTPYECPFMSECIPPAPPHAIGELYNARALLKQRLAADGITMITEIPQSYPLSTVQQRQRDAVATGQAYEHGDLRSVLAGLERPLYFLDFETFNPAVPLYPGTRPYQQIPFQWSVHRMGADGETTHAEYLHDGLDDPRPPLSGALIEALGSKGPICVYSSFEQTQLRGLQEALPMHAAALARIANRLVDLLPVVRNHVYHPDFHGSFSIKRVLPALVPEMGYEGLSITDGSSASVAFHGLVRGELTATERARVRKDLLAYCGRDTEAMVRLYRRFVG